MDPITALNLASTAIKVFVQVEPIIAKSVSNLKPFAIALFEKFTGKSITDEQRTELEDKIDELHNEFQAPIPPEDQQ